MRDDTKLNLIVWAKALFYMYSERFHAQSSVGILNQKPADVFFDGSPKQVWFADLANR